MKSMEKIKQLRELTGAGMVDCKKALDETQGDIEKAVEILRKKGIAKAAKRGERETNEGIVLVETNDDNTEGYMLEINAETDFVAKNEKFQTYANDLMAILKEKKSESKDALMQEKMQDVTAQEVLGTLSGTIGEKMAVKDIAFLNDGAQVAAYSHLGGRIGVLVSFSAKIDETLAKDIAMHVAAASPKYLDPSEVPAEETDKEKDIYKEQLLKEGKPENIIDNILQGKINKYYEEVCLLKQEFIKDDKKKIEEVLGDAKILKFIRFSL